MTFRAVAAFAILAACTKVACADAIQLNTWYEFQFLGTNTAAFGCTLTTCAQVPAVTLTANGVQPPWTITTTSKVSFFLTDAFLGGDQFQLSNNNIKLAKTSAPAAGFVDCGGATWGCYYTPGISHMVYPIAVGKDSFTIQAVASLAGGGTGFFMLGTPEPAAFPVLLAAFLGFTVWRLKRRAKMWLCSIVLMAVVFQASGQTITLVDPWSSLFTNGAITTDVNSLATQGIVRGGVVTDGVTTVVVRFSAPVTATVCFSLTDADGNPLTTPDEDGTLTPLANETGLCGISTVSTNAGQDAFALYTAPSNFIRSGSPGDVNLPSRNVYVTTTYTDGGPEQILRMPVMIMRPLVVLVHGIWDNADGMRPLLVNLLGPVTYKLGPKIGGCYDSPNGYTFCVADYRAQNASSFVTGAPVVGSQIRNFLAQFRKQQGVAAMQAQVVAHSMGGMVTRTLGLCGGALQCPAGQKNVPFVYGKEVSRMITIGTPHQGSNLATYLSMDKFQPVCFKETKRVAGVDVPVDVTLALAFFNQGLPINKGAIDDLAVNSPAITKLNAQQTPFPLNFMVGIAATTDYNLFNNGLLGELKKRCAPVFAAGAPLRMPTTIQSAFNGIASDLIVSVYSQRLGQMDMVKGTTDEMPVIHSVSVTLGAKGFSPDEKSSPMVANDVLNILNNGPFINAPVIQ